MRYPLVQSGAVPALKATRLPPHYTLEVASWRSVCDICQVPLRRQRSSIHWPTGLALGQPRVRCVQKQCPVCHQIYRSEEYPRLVPSFGNYAFDLIVEIGLARFLRHRQNREVQQELEQRWGLRLPCSTISELAQSFLDYLAATHRAHIPELRERLQNDGGYALHVDGTCEAGTDILFNAIAGNRGWTLAGCKMASEDATQIAGLLRLCLEWFGPPLALVRDLGIQIEVAHQQVMPNIPDLICQYHFLENVGTKLCAKDHAKLTSCLRRLKIRPGLGSVRRNLVRWSKRKSSLTCAEIEKLVTRPEQAHDLDPVQARRCLAYALLRWLEDYGADLRGEFFPFDLPALALYHRYRALHDQLVRILPALDLRDEALSTLETIQGHLTTVVRDTELVAAAERLEKAADLFNELREVLRLTGDRCHPLLHQSSVPDRQPSLLRGEEHLQKWLERVEQRRASESDADQAAALEIVIGYLRKYCTKLTGHVITLQDRPKPFLVQRTNNVSEHRFARTKQGLRRKLGTRNLSRYVQAMRPEEFLVANLQYQDYLQIVCGGSLDNLASAFAHNQKAAQAIRAERRDNTTSHPIPLRKKNLRDQKFLSLIIRAIGILVPKKRAAA